MEPFFGTYSRELKTHVHTHKHTHIYIDAPLSALFIVTPKWKQFNVHH